MTKKWLLLGTITFSVGFSLSLLINRDIKRSALNGLLAIPTTFAAVLVSDHQRKRQLSDALSSLQTQVENLQGQEIEAKKVISLLQIQTENLQNQQTNLEQEIHKAIPQQQHLEIVLNQSHNRHEELIQTNADLESISQQLASQVNEQKNKFAKLKQNIEELDQQKQLLESELANRQSKLQEIQQTQEFLQQSLARQQQESEEGIANLKLHSQQLKTEIAELEAQKRSSTENCQHLLSEINQLEIQKSDLQAILSSLDVESQTIKHNQREQDSKLQQIHNQILVEQNRYRELKQKLKVLEEAQKKLIKPQSKNNDVSRNEKTNIVTVKKSSTSLTPVSASKVPSTSLTPLAEGKILEQINFLDCNFMKPEYYNFLWEQQILPYWTHINLPVGQRFLGSIKISRSASDSLLEIVGKILAETEQITYQSLNSLFDDHRHNWLKVFTLAISEYAYYYSDEQFWVGFCQKINVKHNQNIEKTFRRIVDEGVDNLGLVRAEGGYKYVSTLWLQSGIPQQNLNHFAQLVQEMADEYGWWELAHASAQEIAREFLEYCQEKHTPWGTLINFLKASYDENEKAEPISGNLVKAIAIIAQELELQRLSSDVLLDENQREKLLNNNYLPQAFFLRDWQKIIEVLTPTIGAGGNRSIVNRRPKPPYLILDIADTWNKQLILPEQVLWRPQWQDLRGTYCEIPQGNWKKIVPKSGDLEIPELIMDVEEYKDLSYQLINNLQQPLFTWEYNHLNKEFPCLIFNAFTGEYMPLCLEDMRIKAVEEIIYFAPKSAHIILSEGIEVIDGCIPSSIKGWRGQQIKLIDSQGIISLTVSDCQKPQVIIWQLQNEQAPLLTGLKLKGKKNVYLQTPTFWYPPHPEKLEINILIENISERKIIERNVKTLNSNESWEEIILDQWCAKPGKYQLKVWQQTQHWCYEFEIQAKYQISEIPQVNQPKIKINSDLNHNSFPRYYNSSEAFWAEQLEIDQLWTQENIIFLLSNGKNKIAYQMQASTSGKLTLNLSALYDLLPSSSFYTLNYQRLGGASQHLLTMNLFPEAIIWHLTSQGIDLLGISSTKIYSVFYWNLLAPGNKPLEIKLDLIKADSDISTVRLDLPVGIYHLQLFCDQQLQENLGIWCINTQYDLPEEAKEDEDIANYCYSILGNESVEDFVAAAKKLKVDFDIERLKMLLADLESNENNYLPAWLDVLSLAEKIKALLADLEKSLKIDTQDIFPATAKISENKPQTPRESPQLSSWHLIRLIPNTHKKRDIFVNYLNTDIARHNLQHIFREICLPKNKLYQDIVLVQILDFPKANFYIKQIERSLTITLQLEAKVLSDEQIKGMLEAK